MKAAWRTTAKSCCQLNEACIGALAHYISISVAASLCLAVRNNSQYLRDIITDAGSALLGHISTFFSYIFVPYATQRLQLPCPLCCPSLFSSIKRIRYHYLLFTVRIGAHQNHHFLIFPNGPQKGAIFFVLFFNRSLSDSLRTYCNNMTLPSFPSTARMLSFP